MLKHIIRWGITVGLLTLVFLNAHWSVGLVLTLQTIETELSAWIFVKNIKGVYLEPRE